MTASSDAEIVAFFSGSPLGLTVYSRVRELLDPVAGVDVRVSRSQVAFRRRLGFAWLWLPGTYLRHPDAEVVLSLALGRRDPSARWKQVVEPTPGRWMHHLEVASVDDLDDEVQRWLVEAADRAA